MFSEHRVSPRVLLLVLPLAVALLAANPSFCLAAQPQASTGGVLGRMVSLVERGSGLYSWALPVTLSGLLKEAQVETVSSEEAVASVLQAQGLADLSQGLPKEWGPAALKAAARAGSTGQSAGYVLIASWNTRVPQNQWSETTEFWLKARLLKGDAIVFDTTRLPGEADKFYHLADYDLAVRDLAEKVLATVNPAELDQARSRQLWGQHITMTQVRLLAEAEQDIVAKRYDDARRKLGQAQAAATGKEGSLLALRRLIEINQVLATRDPSSAAGLGRQAEDQGDVLEAEGQRTAAWGSLMKAEGRRLQGKWPEAAPAYFSWIQYLIEQKLLQPADVEPDAVRTQLDSRSPHLWEKLTTPSLEAAWWSTVALALYRGLSGDLANPFFERAVACAARETDPSSRGIALVAIAQQQERACDLDAAEKQYLAALKVLAPACADTETCAAAYNGLGRIADARGDADAALKWLDRAMDIRKSNPGSREWAANANDIAVARLHHHDVDLALEWSNKARGALEGTAPASLDLARVYSTLGEVQMERGQTEEAEKVLSDAMHIIDDVAPGSPEYTRVAENLGDVYRRKGDRVKAARFYGKALNSAGFAPGPTPARQKLPDLDSDGNLTFTSARGGDAKQQAFADDTADLPSLDNVSQSFASEGLDLLLRNLAGKALRPLQSAAEIAPDDPRAQSGLAWGYVALRRLPEAAPVIDKVCALGRKALAALMSAWHEKFERLAKQLLDAVDNPNPAGYYALGRFWEATGDADKAAAAYKTFLDRAPADHFFRADAATRLTRLRPK